MGKLTDLMEIETLISDGIDSGDISYFTGYKTGNRDLVYEQVDMPFLILTFSTALLSKNDNRRTDITQTINIAIRSAKIEGTNTYYDSSNDTGVLSDIENVLNTVFVDYDLNNKAEYIEQISYNIEENDGYFVADIEIDINSIPFEPGNI